MDPRVKLQRHSQLWESGIASVRRLAFGGLIFAVVILLNVIEPYWETERSPEIEELRCAVADLKVKKTENERNIADLKKIENTLSEIRRDINSAPWSDEIQELMVFCKGGCPSNTKPKADEIIDRIAAELQAIIVENFRTAIDGTFVAPDFEPHVAAMKQSIKDWQEAKKQTVWYRTKLLKSQAPGEAAKIVQLSATEAENKLGGLNNAAEKEIEETMTALSKKQSELGDSEESFAKQIRAKDEELTRAMNSALPGWATGLFTPERMVNLYPFILAGLAVWILANAWNASRHFRSMADAEGWSAEERSDPLLSSPWTLTRRGSLGSTVTALYYVAVFGILIYCVARSFDVAKPTEQTDQAQAESCEKQSADKALPVSSQ